MMPSNVIPCEEALRRLLTYLDAELEEREHREVDEHLALCRSCFSRAEFERRLRAHLAALGAQPVPPGVQDRIRALVAQFTCD